MKYREFKLTGKGLLIARFLHVLFDDMDFDSNEPMTTLPLPSPIPFNPFPKIYTKRL
jgi:hypothetical protein